MKLYRILSLILALLIALFVLSACNKDKNEDDATENNAPETDAPETDAPTEKVDEPTEKPTEPVINNGTQNDILDNLLQKGEDIAIVDIEFDEELLADAAPLPDFNGKEFNKSGVDMGDGSYLNVAEEASLQDYSDYLYSLYKAG